ncbi:hypothetical protein L596_006294 [Steinernema carpocapsae]|nr:hypothetical protein L596_006294 [Steinernema carpocapsae]
MGRTRSRSCCAIDTQEFSASHYAIATTIIIVFTAVTFYACIMYIPTLLGLLFTFGVRLHNTSFESKCISLIISIFAFALSKKLVNSVQKASSQPTSHMIAMNVIDTVCRHRMTGISENLAFDAVMRCTMREATEEQKAKWKAALAMLRECEPRVAFDDNSICGLQTLYLTWQQVNTNGWEGSVASKSKRVIGPPLSRCLKLRGFYCSSSIDAKAVEKAFLDRVYPLFPLHFLPMSSTRDGVAYVMMNSLDEAKTVMELVHNQWFNGRVVSAKYLTEENYIQRFPDTRIYYEKNS